MGHHHQQSNSSATLVAVIGGGLVLAILGIAVVAAVALFWVRAARMRSLSAVVWEQQAVDQVHRAEAEARQAAAQARHQEAISRLEQTRVAAAAGPRLNFAVKLDRNGNVDVGGEQIGLDELNARLAEIKDKIRQTPSVEIQADPDCPFKHVLAVLNVCQELGEIDYRITSSVDAVVHITATVTSYEPAAEWDHFDDGTFSAYDKITLKVVTPQRHAGTTFAVTVPPTEFPENSPMRTAGTRLTLTIRESDIGATGLAWGAIEAPTIEH